MNKLHPFTTLACAAALCVAAASAQAGVVTFNNPGVITIDGGGVATYSEAGFNIVGPAASFLTLDDALVGGFDGGPFSLLAQGGGLFGLQSLQFAFYDLGFGGAPGSLSVVGLLNGAQVAAQQFSLGTLATASFGAPWAQLTEVRFSASTGFLLDNITANAVPEPTSLALAGLALLALAWQHRSQRRPVKLS
jgi:hypothetical protein